MITPGQGSGDSGYVDPDGAPLGGVPAGDERAASCGRGRGGIAGSFWRLFGSRAFRAEWRGEGTERRVGAGGRAVDSHRLLDGDDAAG